MTVLGLDLVTWVLVAVGLVIATVIYIRRIKKDGPPRYAPASVRQKAASLVLLVAMLGAWAIVYADWHPFGGYEKQVALAAQFVCLLYVIRLTALLERA